MFRVGLAIAFVVAVLDQLTKWWVLAELMDPPRTIPVTGFFTLVLAWNRGVSFSLFSGQLSPYVFSAIAGLIVVGLSIWLWRAENRWLAGAIGLIIGGAVGNIVDRLRFGAVADFLYFHVGEFYWPAFNLADSAITIGVAILIFDSLFGQRRQQDESELDGREG